MSYRKFPYASLEKAAQQVFEKNGVSKEQSERAAAVMLASDRLGIESHGIQRLGMYVSGIKLGRINAKADMKVFHETPLTANIDADDGLGQAAGVMGMELAIAKAKRSGIGIVAVRNSNHFGIGGYYSMMAAKQNLLGLAFTNSEAMVVPTFGKKPMMGTNPIAMSMPAIPTMFHFDISTSVVPAGKVEVFARKKQALPENWSVGREGQVNKDADEFLAIRRDKQTGGLLPLGGFGTTWGGHKGFALSLMVELFTGVLANGLTSNRVREVPGKDRCCHSFWAIDFGLFGDRGEIEKHFSDYLQLVRDSAKADGHDRIYIHGETEAEAEKRVMAEGVPMHHGAYNDLAKLCGDCGVDLVALGLSNPAYSGRRTAVPV